jgi:glutamyl-tRNA reductase
MFLKRRRNRPMLFIDIAVPRNVDPSMEELDGIFVYNIDALQDAASANAQRRQSEAEVGEKIVAAEATRFYSRLETKDVVPTILSLQEHFENIRLSEMQRLRNRLGDLTSTQHAAVDALTRSILKKIMHAPLNALNVADSNARQCVAESLTSIFNLDKSTPTLVPSANITAPQPKPKSRAV